MKRFISLVITVLCTINAYSQDVWTGDFSINGGSSFQRDIKKWSNTAAQADGKIGYKNEGFYFDVYANGSYNHRDKIFYGLSAVESSSANTGTTDYKPTLTTTWKANAGISGGIKTALQNTFKFRYSYSYENKKSEADVVSFSMTQAGITSVQASSNNSLNTKDSHNIGVSYVCPLNKDGRVITADVNYLLKNNINTSNWATMRGDTVNISQNEYRITPTMRNTVISASANYTDQNFCNARGLDMDFSLEFKTSRDDDHQSAATYKDYVWHDSTDYRHNFIFKTITISPKIHAVWVKGIYKLDLAYIPQFYERQLDEDYHDADYENPFVSHIINFRNIFTISENHSFSFNYNRNIERPGYLQTCWFRRSGVKYNNEYYEGNTNLKPAAKHFGTLSYTFKKRRFSANVLIGNEYIFRIIEQTYYTDVLDGKDCRIYTWINGGTSNKTNIFFKLGWDANQFKADASFNVNFFIGVNSRGVVTRSSDYEIKAYASYAINTWTFTASGRYTSKIIRSYTSITPVVGCDFKVEKRFNKWNVYIAANDIFDQDITITTISMDETEKRYEITDENKRIFLIGAGYKF